MAAQSLQVAHEYGLGVPRLQSREHRARLLVRRLRDEEVRFARLDRARIERLVERALQARRREEIDQLRGRAACGLLALRADDARGRREDAVGRIARLARGLCGDERGVA